jgi:hypothetical protein
MQAVSAKTRVQWIDLKGKEVLFMDFAGASIQESLDMIAIYDKALQGRAEASVLMLTDLTNAEYDPSIARQWKEARNRHDAAIRASAMYGIKGLVALGVRGFIEARLLLGFSRKNEPRIFTRGDQAREWLAEQ